MGKIPARNNHPGSQNYPYLYDIQPNGSQLRLGDAWENFKMKNDEPTQMPEFTRAVVPIAILMAHIFTASFIINRIGSKLNQNYNSKCTIFMLIHVNKMRQQKTQNGKMES